MPDLITRRAPFERSTFDRERRVVDAILSTGADVERRDARGSFVERLCLDGAAIPSRVPLLDHHQRTSIAHVLGHADGIRLEGGEVRATLHIADDRALSLIDSGSISGVSIGYLPAVETWLEEGGRRVRSLTPTIHECSLAIFGADPGAQLLRSKPEMEPEIINRAETNAAIRNLVRTAGLPAGFGDTLIDEGATVEAAQAAAYREMTSRAVLPPTYGPIGDEPAALVTRCAEALAHRWGVPGELSSEAAQYRALDLHDMGRAILAARGERVLSLSVEALLTRMTTTGDLPGLLIDSGNRTLMASYTAAASPVKALAKASQSNDFRPKTALRLGLTGLLERVAEHGEIRHGGFTETKETYALVTLAKIWSLSRQALINGGDLNAFGDMSAMMGRVAAETEARALVDLLIANAGLGPTMDDGITLIDRPAHGNESTTGTVIDAASLAAGVQAMRTQKGISGEPINAVPVFLLVSPLKEHEARQALASYFPANAADVNPLAGQLQILVEPRLTGNRWWLFSSPSILPVFEYSYLSSAPGPQMSSRESFEVLGLEFRVVLDWGAGVLDWRGIYSNAGA